MGAAIALSVLGIIIAACGMYFDVPPKESSNYKTIAKTIALVAAFVFCIAGLITATTDSSNPSQSKSQSQMIVGLCLSIVGFVAAFIYLILSRI